MKDIMKVEQILKSIANKKRLEILKFLKRRKEAIVVDISDAIHLSFRSTSKHLIQLHRVGIIERTQKSKFVYYTISQILYDFAKFTFVC